MLAPRHTGHADYSFFAAYARHAPATTRGPNVKPITVLAVEQLQERLQLTREHANPPTTRPTTQPTCRCTRRHQAQHMPFAEPRKSTPQLHPQTPTLLVTFCPSAPRSTTPSSTFLTIMMMQQQSIGQNLRVKTPMVQIACDELTSFHASWHGEQWSPCHESF